MRKFLEYLVFLGLVAVLLSACGGASGNSESGGANELVDHVETVVAFSRPGRLSDSLHGFWSSELQTIESSLTAPAVFWEPYDSHDSDLPLLCGGNIGPSSIYAMSSYYCPAEQRILWDKDIGGKGISVSLSESLVVAHEYGHALQAKYPQLFGSIGGQRSELQADCLAGVWSAYAFEDTSTSLLESAFKSTIQPVDHHGLPAERKHHYTRGFAGGLHACLEDIG